MFDRRASAATPASSRARRTATVRLSMAATGSVVVCGEVDPDKDRLPGREDLESVRSTNDGLPRAPRFDRGSCKGQPGCVSVGSVPDPVYYVDVKDLPEAPAGSDADLIATGEKAEP